MYRLYKCSVNIYSWKTKGTEPMTNIGTKTVSCDTIGSNTEKDKICPVMGIGKNAFFLTEQKFLWNSPADLC